MTYIAIAAHRDHAEVSTDSLSYSGGGCELSYAPKVTVLDNVNAVLTSRGGAAFGVHAGQQLAALDCNTFDDLLQQTRRVLRSSWAWYAQRAAREGMIVDDLTASTVLVVGYSDTRARFCTMQFASENQFRPVEISGLFVMPTPAGFRPPERELELRYTRMLSGGDSPGEARAEIAELRRLPQLSTPTSIDEWATLAKQVRRSRALGPLEDRVFLGGDVHLTRLQVDAPPTAVVVHQFDDTGDEFREMIRFTFHPAAQAEPCVCGSGRRFAECHQAPFLDEACPCGTDALFRECHSILAADRVKVAP